MSAADRERSRPRWWSGSGRQAYVARNRRSRFVRLFVPGCRASRWWPHKPSRCHSPMARSLSQLVVNFMGDAEAGVREMARVTRPGGVVASSVCDYAGEMRLLRAFWDAAREIDPERAAAADEGVVMRWCAEGELADLWRATGLGSVRFVSLVASAKYADFEDLWSPLPTGVAPAGAFCKSLEEDDQGTLRDAFRRRLGIGEGPFELTARAWAVAGTVPG